MSEFILPSFIPPPQVAALRDLTRTRVTLVQTRSQIKNRIHKVLQETNIKLGCVITDLFGKSGRAMLDALVEGRRDPKELANMALRRLRSKIPQLQEAAEGDLTEHHAALIRMSLQQLDLLNQQIEEMDLRIGQIEKEEREIASAIELLVSIPGVEQTAARAIIAEIGADMSQLGTDKRMASWAGVCPGNNESAGKRKSGKTRKGNRWLRRVLNQSAWAARKTSSFLGNTFKKLQTRIGGKKAAMAVSHKILVIAYHLLTDGTLYDETTYQRNNKQLEAYRRINAIRTLKQLGYQVILEPATV